MTIKFVTSFIATFLILNGVYSCLKGRVYSMLYNKYKEDGESMFEFLCRVKGGFFWELRKKMGLSWYYNSKTFNIFSISLGILLIVLGVALFIFLFWFQNSSEYSVFLDIKL